jgi:hypothetical protein
MTIEEHRAELISQIAYHKRELEHLREFQGEGILGFIQNMQRLVAVLIASLEQQLSDLPVTLPTDLTEPLTNEAA